MSKNLFLTLLSSFSLSLSLFQSRMQDEKIVIEGACGVRVGVRVTLYINPQTNLMQVAPAVAQIANAISNNKEIKIDNPKPPVSIEKAEPLTLHCGGGEADRCTKTAGQHSQHCHYHCHEHHHARGTIATTTTAFLYFLFVVIALLIAGLVDLRRGGKEG